MRGFIEAKEVSSNNILIRVGSIVAVRPHKTGMGTHVYTLDGGATVVMNGYEDVKSLIRIAEDE